MVGVWFPIRVGDVNLCGVQVTTLHRMAYEDSFMA